MANGLREGDPRHPSIAVVVPNYNHGNYLRRMLRKLCEQTRPPDEIVLVDDASTDDSVAIIEAYAAKLPQLKLIRNKANIGTNRSTNRGAGESRSDYIVCAGADDYLERNFIERMQDALLRFPAARLCISQYVEHLEMEDRVRVHGRDDPGGCWYVTDGEQYFDAEEFRALLSQRYVCLPINGAVVHRDTFIALGGYDPELRWHADWFIIYAIAFRFGFAVIPEPLSMIRIAPGSFSSGVLNPGRQRAVCNAIYDKLNTPEFRDLYAACREFPAAMSPLLRPFMMALARRLSAWPYLLAILSWWMGEVRRGRRPGVLRKILAGWE